MIVYQQDDKIYIFKFPKNHMKRVLGKWDNKVNYRKRNIIFRNNIFDIVKYTFSVPKITNKKIIFSSDLHIQSKTFHENLLVEKINNLKPDWIIFGGDLLTLLCYQENSANFLSRLTAKECKLSTLGNWEERRLRWMSLDRWKLFYQSAGFTLLANSYYETKNIQFLGLIPDNKNYSFIKKNKFSGTTCLISHKPDDSIHLYNSELLKPDISLCGHTHGGQIRIPWFGAIVTSSKYWKSFEYGYYHNKKSNTNLIVSSGLGYTGIKHRLLCRPEIVLIEFI
jgi:uncharacterized protein